MNRIKAATKDDLERMIELEQVCFYDAWSDVGVRDAFLDDTYSMFVLFIEESIQGYIIGRRILDESELLRVAVNPNKRRQGLGEVLVGYFLDYVDGQDVVDTFLEVRESNFAARELYVQMGFQETGIRPKYYHHPEEAAVLMKRTRNEE